MPSFLALVKKATALYELMEKSRIGGDPDNGYKIPFTSISIAPGRDSKLSHFKALWELKDETQLIEAVHKLAEDPSFNEDSRSKLLFRLLDNCGQVIAADDETVNKIADKALVETLKSVPQFNAYYGYLPEHVDLLLDLTKFPSEEVAERELIKLQFKTDREKDQQATKNAEEIARLTQVNIDAGNAHIAELKERLGDKDELLALHQEVEKELELEIERLRQLNTDSAKAHLKETTHAKTKTDALQEKVDFFEETTIRLELALHQKSDQLADVKLISDLELEATRRELFDLKHTLTAREEELTELQMAYTNIEEFHIQDQENAHSLLEKLGIQRKLVEILQTKLQDAEEKNSDLATQLSAAQVTYTEHSDLIKQLSTVQNNYTHSELQLNSLNGTLKHTMEQNKKLKQQVNALEQKIEQKLSANQATQFHPRNPARAKQNQVSIDNTNPMTTISFGR